MPIPMASIAARSDLVFGIHHEDGNFPAEINLEDLDGSDGYILNGADLGDSFGQSASLVGDVNGDGYLLFIGAPGGHPNDNWSNTKGENYVIFGSRDNLEALDALDGDTDGTINLVNPDGLVGSLDGSNGFVLNGIVEGDEIGFDVSAAGDLNGDGIDDLVTGAFKAASFAGETYVVFGVDHDEGNFPAEIDLNDLDGSNGYTLTGIAADDWSGDGVSGAGDVNGDGVDDLSDRGSTGRSQWECWPSLSDLRRSAQS